MLMCYHCSLLDLLHFSRLEPDTSAGAGEEEEEEKENRRRRKKGDAGATPSQAPPARDKEVVGEIHGPGDSSTLSRLSATFSLALPTSAQNCQPFPNTATLSLTLPLLSHPHHFHRLPSIPTFSALTPSPWHCHPLLQHSHSLPSIPTLSPVLPPYPQYSHPVLSADTLSLALPPSQHSHPLCSAAPSPQHHHPLFSTPILSPAFPPSSWFPASSQAQTTLGKVYLHLGNPKDWTDCTGSQGERAQLIPELGFHCVSGSKQKSLKCKSLVSVNSGASLRPRWGLKRCSAVQHPGSNRTCKDIKYINI